MHEWLPGFSAHSITADAQSCSWELEGRATRTADSCLPASQRPAHLSWSLAASWLPWNHRRHPSVLEASGEMPTSTTSIRSPCCSGEPSRPSTVQWRQVCEEEKPGSPLLASLQRTKCPSSWVLLQNKLRNSLIQVFIRQGRQPQPWAQRVVSTCFWSASKSLYPNLPLLLAKPTDMLYLFSLLFTPSTMSGQSTRYVYRNKWGFFKCFLEQNSHSTIFYICSWKAVLGSRVFLNITI